MTSRISHTSVDCSDADALSEWWKGVLGYTDVPGDPNEVGHEECMIVDPVTDHRVLFIEVPDPTPGKNLVHVDLRPTDRSQNEKVDLVDRRRCHNAPREVRPGTGWMTLSDPEGDLFRVLTSGAGMAALG